MLVVSRAVAAIAGPERTGIRISPVTPANDVSDSNPQPLFDYIVDALDALKLVYIHVIEGATGEMRMPVRSAPTSAVTAFATSSMSLARFSIEPP